MDYEKILNLPLDEYNDAGVDTIKEYLHKLLVLVWKEGEGFSGKRPFGNSGWEYDLYRALAKGGIVNATFDEEGYVETLDYKKANKIISDVIDYIFDNHNENNG